MKVQSHTPREKTSVFTPTQREKIKASAVRFARRLEKVKTGPIANEDSDEKRKVLAKLNGDAASLENFVQRGAEKAKL